MLFAFYISGKSGRLTKFLEQVSSNILRQIKLVVSDDEIEENLIHKLNEADILSKTYKWNCINNISKKEKRIFFSNMLLRELKINNIDYCFSFGSHILEGNILYEYQYRIINFHPAILPMFPGIKAIDQAVQCGNVLLVGNTAHFIDEGIDTGLIIMQSIMPIQHFYDSNFDYNTILDLQIPMLNRLIEIINSNCLKIEDGKVIIKNADYSQSHIYPNFLGDSNL